MGGQVLGEIRILLGRGEAGEVDEDCLFIKIIWFWLDFDYYSHSLILILGCKLGRIYLHS